MGISGRNIRGRLHGLVQLAARIGEGVRRAGDHLVEDGAERVDVGALVGRAGRVVARGAVVRRDEVGGRPAPSPRPRSSTCT